MLRLLTLTIALLILAPPADAESPPDPRPAPGRAFDEATAASKLAQIEQIRELILATSNKRIDDLPGTRIWDYTDSQGNTRKAKLFVPAGYDPATDRGEYPLVIVVNSANFRMFFTPEFQAIFPCFGLMVPSLKHNWVSTPWSRGTVDFDPDPRWEMAHFLELLDHVLEQNPGIDRERIYATGNSRDAFFCWDLAARRPDLIAAIAPLSGGGDPLLAELYMDKGIWAFIGHRDNVVPTKGSREMIEAVRAAALAAGRDKADVDHRIRLTGFPAGHDIWKQVYGQPELYVWLFSQRLVSGPEQKAIRAGFGAYVDLLRHFKAVDLDADQKARLKALCLARGTALAEAAAPEAMVGELADVARQTLLTPAQKAALAAAPATRPAGAK